MNLLKNNDKYKIGDKKHLEEKMLNHLNQITITNNKYGAIVKELIEKLENRISEYSNLLNILKENSNGESQNIDVLEHFYIFLDNRKYYYYKLEELKKLFTDVNSIKEINLEQQLLLNEIELFKDAIKLNENYNSFSNDILIDGDVKTLKNKKRY